MLEEQERPFGLGTTALSQSTSGAENYEPEKIKATDVATLKPPRFQTTAISHMIRTSHLIGITWLCLLSITNAQETLKSKPGIRFTESGGKVSVFADDKLFTELDYKTWKKPVLFPILNSDQIEMTRRWPMVDDKPDEPRDHPHHKSMWVGHLINDVDFWTEKEGEVRVNDVKIEQDLNRIATKSSWLRMDDHSEVCCDESIYQFCVENGLRWIDVSITFNATNGELVFADTKEGTFAIRVHPNLQLTPTKVNLEKGIQGTAINSEGLKDKMVWGQKAKWVAYQGTIEEKPVTITILDHPSNLRHPTTWHARDYGLFAANPFGITDFGNKLNKQEKTRKQGEWKVESGKKLTLRYRALFASNHASPEQINQWYNDFESDKPTSLK